MRKVYYPLLLLAIAIIPSFVAYTADETESCLLLNDNTFRFGSIVDFHNGFLYFKEQQQILKISPAHFIGIFDTREHAENALIILNEPSRLTDIRELQPIFDYIYKKAKLIISRQTPRSELISKFTLLLQETTDIKTLLDISVYKEALLLSAISHYYNFQPEFKEFLYNLNNWKKTDTMDKHTLLCLEIKLKAIEYLYNNPYIND